MENILITGGAGFIGSHLADKLISRGYNVRILDNLNEQVHGKIKNKPHHLNNKAEFVFGEIRSKEDVKKSLKDIDVVFHFAAMVGVGQSMYEIREYTDVNNTGTAVLLEALIEKPVKKLITASSMSIYGEGLYKNKNGNISEGLERSFTQLKQAAWEVYDENGNKLIPYPTPESKKPSLSSIYALSKYDQERMTLITGNAYNIPSTALRFFNVYGTRQALSNPYTGVLAIFASRLLNNNPPIIFEDGNQKRDFVNVHDIADACLLAMENEKAAGEVFNIGSGNAYTIKEIAVRISQVLNKPEIQPEIIGKYRVGDIRHCYSDITKAKNILGYNPKISLEEGLTELADWLKDQKAEDKVKTAKDELTARGLTV